MAELVPTHDARVALIDRIGGDEDGERETRLLESRPRLHEGRARSVVDGDADGALRQRLACAERGENLGHREHRVAAFREVLDVRLELFDGDARRRVLVLAEAVVLQDDRRIGGDRRADSGRNRDGRDEYGAESTSDAAGPTGSHGLISPVPAAVSHSRG